MSRVRGTFTQSGEVNEEPWPAYASAPHRLGTSDGRPSTARSSRQRSKSFDRKVDAQRYANNVETDIERRDWIDPRGAKQTFGEWANRWIATTTHLQPTTQQGYESIVTKHLLPRFGELPIGSLDHPTVLAFLSDLKAAGAAPGTIRNVRDVARLILDLAVRSGIIKTNPVKGVKAPRSRPNEMVFLNADEVVALAEAIIEPPVMRRRRKQDKPDYPEYGLLVRFAAWTGLRAGEIVALRVGKLDLMRRRVEVSESAAEAHGRLSFGSTKTYAAAVAIAAPLADPESALHMGAAIRLPPSKHPMADRSATELVPAALQV